MSRRPLHAAVCVISIASSAIGCGGGEDGMRASTSDASMPQGASDASQDARQRDAASDGQTPPVDGANADSVPSANDTGGLDRGTLADADAIAACSAYAAAYCARYEVCYPHGFRGYYATADLCRRRVAQFCPNEFGAPETSITPGALATCAGQLMAE